MDQVGGKRQPTSGNSSTSMPGTLHIIATPIGNLEDITLRAIRLLGSVSVVAAEDTRHSAKLLSHLGLSPKTISYHEHNAWARLPGLLERLRAGQDVALITDAGTPAVSDPGIELIQACIREEIAVNPVPGASAPLTAAVASGFPVIPMTILGFVPQRSKDRTRWIEMVSGIGHTVAFFESPTRVATTLEQMSTSLGKRHICVARELTKTHQELIRGRVEDVRSRLADVPKGEFTLVLGPVAADARPPVEVSDADLLAEFERITEVGAGSRRDAVAELARTYNRTARDVYGAIERAKSLVDAVASSDSDTSRS